MMKNKMLSIILVVSIVCMAMALPTHAATTFVTTTAGNAAVLDGAGAGDVTELTLSGADGGGTINVSTIAVLRDDGGIDGAPDPQWLSMDSDSMGVGNDKWGGTNQRWLFSFDQEINFDAVEFWGGTQDMQIYSEAWIGDADDSGTNWNFDGSVGMFTFTTNASGPAETFDFTSAGVSSVAAGTQITIVDTSGGGAEMGSFTITPGGGSAGFDFDPTPADGATVPPSASLALSWVNVPDCNDASDTATFEVYWDTDAAGDNEAQIQTPAVSTPKTVDVTADQIGTYYWKIVATDPNTGGTPYVLEEAVYSFTTGTINLEPTITVTDLGFDYDILTGDPKETTFAIEATVNDPDGDTTGHIYSWTSSPAGANFANPASLSTDVTFDTAGVYDLEVKVIDGQHTDTDTVNVTVYADGCAAAKIEAPYSETDARLKGDTNYDCKVNLADLAALASSWLDNESF